LGLSSGDRVPDARSIWLFQDNLVKQNLEETLFDQFHNYLEDKGLFVNEGKIVDASFVEVPRQRNKKDENEKIIVRLRSLTKSGEGSELWNDNPYKKRQKDIDARWMVGERSRTTEKNGEKYYGYKNHAKIDSKSKLIDTYDVTSAEVHDSQPIENLLREDDSGQELYADSAYTGEPIDKMLKTRSIIPQIIEKAFKNKPLTDEQKALNKIKSKTRCRVEHPFGFVTNSMHDFYTRNIGFRRVKGVIGLINLVYNMCRYEQIIRLQLLPVRC